MTLNPRNTGQTDPSATNFHWIRHKRFLDIRQNMRLAYKAMGAAQWKVEYRIDARNKAYAIHSKLFRMAEKGQLSSSLLKDLKDAEITVREREALLNESRDDCEAAMERHIARRAAFEQAKSNCENSGCKESHDARGEMPEIFEEEQMARKAAKERQRRWRHQYEQSEAKKVPLATGHPKSNSKRFATQQFTYKEWIVTIQEAFRDYAKLASFPSPPAKPCSKPSCMSEARDGTRALTACACNIRQGLQHLSTGQLKDLRLFFHPDKFSKCRADLVEPFKKQASEIFVVVEAMYREKKSQMH